MAAPGWYPDPQNPGLFLYWDGSRWTERRLGAPLPAKQQKQNVVTWVVVGLACVALGITAIIGVSTHGFKNMRDYKAGYGSATANPIATQRLWNAGGLNRFGLCMHYLGMANSNSDQVDYGYEDFLEGCYDGLDKVLGPGPHGI